MAESFTGASLPPPDLERLHAAVRAVWASKWGARAVRAAAAVGTPLDTLAMSVLLQPLVAARAAFVSHTRDPRGSSILEGSGSTPRMYVEAVTGLGEALVGNVSGRALCYTVDVAAVLQAAPAAGAPPLKCLGGAGTADTPLAAWVAAWPETALSAALAALHVEAAPSKAWAVHAKGAADGAATCGLIARSASNMEDLAGYAGAGVFDSVTTNGVVYAPAAAAAFDAGFKVVGAQLIAIALAAAEVATQLGGEQDIEGVVTAAGDITIVQARPQV